MMLTFNSKEYFENGVLNALKEALDDYDYHLLVIDGDSHDGTIEEIHKEFSDKATVLVFKESNLAICRNLALEKAPKDADFYCWIDSDILIPKNFFSRLIPLFKDSSVGTAEIRALLRCENKAFVPKYYKELREAKGEGVKESEGGATTCLIMRPEVATRIKLDPRFKRAGEDVSLHYQVNEMGYKTLIDLNDPPALHVRKPTLIEELRRLIYRGEARALNLKIHSRVIRSRRLERAIISSLLTLGSWLLLIYGLFLMFLPALIPFILLLVRHAFKLRKPWLLHLALIGLILSTVYLIGFMKGFLKYWILKV
jgi:glycosyltransferase involved in cell wall biosynthesis